MDLRQGDEPKGPKLDTMSKDPQDTIERGLDVSSGDVISPEYAEYLRLHQLFVGGKLSKLVRKIE